MENENKCCSSKKYKEEYVEALYTELLGRKSDTSGKKYWCEALEVYGPKFVISNFIKAEEFQKNIAQIKHKHNLTLSVIDGYSEYGEDEFLVSFLINSSVENLIFVDVGAHSTHCSNSYFFYKHLDWSGIAIEANPTLAEGLSNSLPPQVKVINKAISTTKGSIDFFVSENTYVSSIYEEDAKSWGKPVKKITVEAESLQSILSAENIPEDFGILSIDIEGHDLEVLESLLINSGYRPSYIIVELANLYSESGNSLSFSSKISEEYELINKTKSNLILRYLHRL